MTSANKRTSSAKVKSRSQALSKSAILPPDSSIGYMLRDTYRAFARMLQNKIGPSGVTMGMWYFLRVLWEEDGLTQRELSRRANMMEPTTASALKLMERRRLIKRRRNPQDQRKINVYLTREGKTLERKLLPHAVEVNRVALETLTSQDTDLLRRLFRQMKASLAIHESENAMRSSL